MWQFLAKANFHRPQVRHCSAFDSLPVVHGSPASALFYLPLVTISTMLCLSFLLISCLLASPFCLGEIDCLKFSKLSISTPPNSHKGYGTTSSSTPDYRQNVTSYKPLLPRIEFPTSQFDRLLHMDQNQFKNSWRANSYENEKKKK